MIKERAIQKDGKTIEFLPEMIGEGTMKQVYFTPDLKSVICFFKDPAAGRDLVRLQRLEAILGKYNPTVPEADGGAAQSPAEAEYYRNLYCWPTAIVTKPRFGLVTPTYPANYFFKSPSEILHGKEKNGMRFIGPKNRALLTKFAPDELGTWDGYLTVCIQMARAVARLHLAGLAHSDLSPNNVLVDPSGGASVVIDIDSLVVEGLFPPDVLGTKGYIAPEVLSTIQLPLTDPRRKYPNPRTDQHALAVLIYQYLLRRHPLEGVKIPRANSAEEQELLSYGSEALYCEHPTDASNRPAERSYVPCTALGAVLNELFERAFTKGLHSPNDRPGAREWLAGLVKTRDLLLPCPRPACSHRWFVFDYPRVKKCPFCSSKPPDVVPILHLRMERRPGQWMADKTVVVYQNRPLYKWHVYDNIFSGPEVDRAPQAYCLFHEGRWLLINQQLAQLTSPGGSRVPPGQAVELKHGATFHLTQEDHGRLAEVEMCHPNN
jgi:serine/threonine protein kinase